MQQVKPKKRLGQNFLVDKGVVKLIINVANINNNDIIIEPGSGLGVVTECLIKTGAEIIGVEIDTNLATILQKRFINNKNFHLKTESVLKSNFNILTKGQNYKIVGSIPYQISSPLIHKILFEQNRPLLVSIIIQKEVAEKIVGSKNKGTYMSNMVNLFYKSEIIKIIKPQAFDPAPKIDSALLLLTLKNELPKIDLRKFKGFLHKAFANRRKMLNKTFKVKDLKLAGIENTVRAQEVSLNNFIKLYKIQYDV